MLSDRPQEPQFSTIVFTDAYLNKDYCHVLFTSEVVSPSIVEETTIKAFSAPLKTMKQIPNSVSSDLFSPTIDEPRESDMNEPQKYVTIAFCMRSKSEHIQGLREMLEAMNNNITHTLEKYRNSRGRLINRILASSETLRNMLWLLNEAFIPPPEVSLVFKIGEEEVRLPPDPLFGLNHSENCFKVLFDVLDVGQILTLYKSLMLEQSVTVLARQKQLLFCICEALRLLMFPLEWQRTYTPLLSEDFLRDAESFLGTYFIGLNAYLAVEDFTNAFDGATMLDIATSRLYVPQPVEFCPIIEAKLRYDLQKLKNPQYSKLDSVNLKGPSPTPNLLSTLAAETSPSDYIRKAREAFLGVWDGVLKNYQAYIYKNEIDENDFNKEKFLDEFQGCTGPNCACKDFWSKVINTTGFDEFVRQSRWLNESNATRLQSFDRPEDAEEPQEYEYVMQPNIGLIQMYDQLQELLAALVPKDQRVHAIKNGALHTISSIKKQISLYSESFSPAFDWDPCDVESRGTSTSVDHIGERSLPISKTTSLSVYPSMKPQISLRPVSPNEPSPDLNIWYGKYGLLSLLRALEVLDSEDIKGISSWEESIDQLSSTEMVWQEHLIKATILELSEGAPGDIVDEYVKACEKQPYCLPKYKFALHLSDLIIIKPERVRELVGANGDVKKVAKAVWDDKESQLFEKTVAKVNVSSIDRQDSILGRKLKSEVQSYE